MCKINCYILSLAFIFLTCASGAAFSQPQEKPADKKDNFIEASELELAVEKAIRKLEKDREFKERQFVEELKSKLRLAVQEWISSESRKRQGELDKIIQQNWQLYPNAVTAGRYDYYLRDFKYSIGNSDIIKTGSLVSPYKAYFDVDESLYAERRHPSNASYPKEYLFKAVTPIAVVFDYRGGEFAVAEVEKANIIFTRGWE